MMTIFEKCPIINNATFNVIGFSGAMDFDEIDFDVIRTETAFTDDR